MIRKIVCENTLPGYLARLAPKGETMSFSGMILLLMLIAIVRLRRAVFACGTLWQKADFMTPMRSAIFLVGDLSQ